MAAVYDATETSFIAVLLLKRNIIEAWLLSSATFAISANKHWPFDMQCTVQLFAKTSNQVQDISKDGEF